MSTRVLVVLPTFNGAHFLPEQLASILAQDQVETHIVCRDDGSSDHSAAVLAQWADKHPGRFTLLTQPTGNLGVKHSFSALLEGALTRPVHGPTYFALADQDDVWHPNKLATLVAAIQAIEAEHPQQPALVHSDLRVVDAQRRVIAERMSQYQGLHPERSGLRAQLVSNTLTGCTALMNRALVSMSTPIPEHCVMHDHWISIVASAFGHRRFLPQALVDYRQHSDNALGAKAQMPNAQYRWPTSFKRIKTNLQLLSRHAQVAFNRDHHSIFTALSEQAHTFSRTFSQQLSAPQRRDLRWVMWLDGFPPIVQRMVFRILRRS
jgi:glycosyltransferase involved in cell wall biosynthesis